jgi:hypothetical protein
MSPKKVFEKAYNARLPVDTCVALSKIAQITGETVDFYNTPLHEDPFGESLTLVIGDNVPKAFTEWKLVDYVKHLQMMAEVRQEVELFTL